MSLAELVAVTPQPASDHEEQARLVMSEVEAYVRNNRRLAANKKLTKRIGRLNELLTTVTHNALTTTKVSSSKKMNLMQRLVPKKMNRKISRQLALANPKKAMANKSILAVGAITVVIGLLILLLNGSGALGVIILLARAVVLVLGLLSGS